MLWLPVIPILDLVGQGASLYMKQNTTRVLDFLHSLASILQVSGSNSLLPFLPTLLKQGLYPIPSLNWDACFEPTYRTRLSAAQGHPVVAGLVSEEEDFPRMDHHPLCRRHRFMQLPGRMRTSRQHHLSPGVPAIPHPMSLPYCTGRSETLLLDSANWRRRLTQSFLSTCDPSYQ